MNSEGVFSGRLRSIEDLGGSMIEAEILTARQNEILVLIQQNPKISYRDMAVQLGINDSAVKKHLNHLRDAGWLERVGGTRGYWLVKKSFNVDHLSLNNKDNG